MRTLQRHRILTAAIALLIALPIGLALASPSNKWRIQVSSDADSDGVVVFQVAPVGGTPIDVTVPIPDDTAENDISRLISDAFRVQLAGKYSVEVDDGEDVLVKKLEDGADFDLMLLEKTVEGVRITLDQE